MQWLSEAWQLQPRCAYTQCVYDPMVARTTQLTMMVATLGRTLPTRSARIQWQ